MSVTKRNRRVSSYKREYHKHKSQIKDINQKARHLTNETVESTRRMKTIVTESHHAGLQTSKLLNDQEKKLDISEKNLGALNESLKTTHKDLKKLELGEELDEDPISCWWFACYLCCRCYKCHRIDTPAQVRVHPTPISEQTTGPPEASPSKQNSQAPQKSGRRQSSQTGHNGRKMRDPQEDEIITNLHEVSSTVGSLKTIAEGQNVKLTESNKRLDKLVEATKKNDEHLKWAQRRTSKLLKR